MVGMKLSGINKQQSIAALGKRSSSKWLNIGTASKSDQNSPIIPILSPLSSKINQKALKPFDNSGNDNIPPPTNSTFNNGTVYQLIEGTEGHLELYSAQIGSKFSLVKTRLAPSNRSGFSFTFLDKRHLFLYGGIADDVKHNEMYVLDLDDREWRLCKVIAPVMQTRSNTQCISTVDGNYFYIYVFGGLEGPKTLANLDIIIFYKDSFKYINPMCSVRSYNLTDGPCGRAKHSFIKFNDKGYLFGGVDTRGKCLGDLWEFNFNNALNPQWSLLSSVGPDQRCSHISYVKDNSFCIAGGFDDDGKFVGDIWGWDTKWTRLSVFETSYPVFGTEEGLYFYSKTLKPVQYMNAGKTLDMKFRKLLQMQSLHRAASIVEKEAENSTVQINTALLQWQRELMKEKPDPEVIDAVDQIFNEKAATDLEAEVVQLRAEVLGLSKKILEAHQTVPQQIPSSKLQEFSDTLDFKLKTLEAKVESPHDAATLAKAAEKMATPQTDPIDVDPSSIEAISAVFDKSRDKDAVLSSIVALQRMEYEKLSNSMIALLSAMHQHESKNSARIATLSEMNSKIQKLREHVVRSERECARIEKATKRISAWGKDADLFMENRDDIEETLDKRNKKRIDDYIGRVSSLMGNEQGGLMKLFKLINAPMTATAASEIYDIAESMELVY